MSERGDNIVLVGMPGAGKSTVGVLLAKAASMDFLDTDVVIQSAEGRRLQAILDEVGVLAFRRMEERHCLGISPGRTVVATGGSVVYGRAAMEHFRRLGRIVWLDLPLDSLRARLTNLDSRGVVMWPGQTIETIHVERTPLYRRWADVTIGCARKSQERIVEEILARMDGGGVVG
jgi:shikimate kinase